MRKLTEKDYALISTAANSVAQIAINNGASVASFTGKSAEGIPSFAIIFVHGEDTERIVQAVNLATGRAGINDVAHCGICENIRPVAELKRCKRCGKRYCPDCADDKGCIGCWE